MTQPLNAQQLYPQQGGANAVSINIYNPQAYGNMPQTGQAPQNVAPYNYTNSLYQMPQASAYQQAPQMPNAYQQYMPMQSPIQQPVMQMPAQQPIMPAPQFMPDSVMSAPQINNQQAPVINQPEEQTSQTEKATTAESPVEVQDTATQAPTVNIDELVQGLADADVDKKADTINKLAELAQSEPDTALQIVSEPIMNALINVINEDTTALEGPTDKQVEVAEKIAKGEQLTPEEDALSEQLSPRDKANKNRIFALYTLAMVQKLQRDELNQYIETQKANGQEAIPPLKIEELPGYNDVVNVLQNDARPEVKVAAMQAIQYVAEPEDKQTVETILADSLNSTDEGIKAAAQDVMARFGTEEAEAPAEKQKA